MTVLGKYTVQIGCEVVFCTVLRRKTTAHFLDNTIQLAQRTTSGATQFQEIEQHD